MGRTGITRSILAVAIWCLSGTRPALALDNLRVAYPSMNTSVFSLLIAQKEGYFKEEGLNVELLSIRGEIAIRTTLAGEVDFFTNAGSALAAAVRGVPVKLVTVFQDKPGWDLIAQPDIKSVTQLRGKNIAILHDGQAYGQGLAAEVKKTLNLHGTRELIFERITPGLAHYLDVIEKIQAAN